LQFTRLRVLGFKSFVEPTELLIEPGLTGIVGPNGCGKSNIVEALRWVMGEASYKNMRASAMDDVIFSGSLNRPARNTAEVSLTADNSDRTAPAALNDADVLDVTRRIEREAGSVYRINGRDVRARDVQLLFADASTGAHSPAMVGQGRIGELIAAKPTDRRMLLEEAAGISGLHSRRHEAELRLRGAETNLGRIDDVIGEIESQLEALKRQARQAVRYRNLSGDIRRAEAAVFHLRWKAAEKARAEAEDELSASRSGAAERATEQAEAAKNQAIAADRMPKLRDEAAAAAAVVQRLRLAGESLDAEQKRVSERLDALGRHLAELGEDIARETRMADENESALARLSDEERELASANAGADEREQEAGQRVERAAAALRESEDKLDRLTRQHADLAAARKQLEQSVADARRRSERLQADRDSVRARVDDLTARSGDASALGEMTAALERARTGEETAETEAGTAEETATAMRNAVDLARNAVDTARAALAEVRQTAGRIETEQKTLQRLLTVASSSDAPLIDEVEVDAGFEAALAAAFGDDLDAPAETDASVHWRDLHGTDDVPLPGGTTPLATHVRAPPLLRHRLAHIGVVEREDGARLQPDLRPGQRLVSQQGDLWRWDGYVAAAEADSPAARRLESRNRLGELGTEAEAARARVEACAGDLEAAEKAHNDARNAANAARAKADAARQRLRDARQAVERARSAHAKAEADASRVAATLQGLQENLARLDAEVGENEGAVGLAIDALAKAPAVNALDGDLESLRADVAAGRSRLAEARAVAENLGREAAMRSNRLAAIERERRDWLQRGQNATAQMATLTRRVEAFETEKTELSDEPQRIEARRRRLLTEAGEAEQKQRAAADKLAEGEAVMKQADAAAREALEQLSTARETHARNEERAVAARERVGEITRQIAEALECLPHEAAGIAEFKPDKPLPDLADTEARLERYRRERERLGAVNLRADAEAQEIGERRDALTTERDDLIAAIHKLRASIGSLNREGRERLVEAFHTVDAHFRNLFTHLFGGGEAELQLTESDDPLEAGLEIIARPPGKKPQIMTLLSGGEQALTAMSLIFAVFLTNPAPICVLDEVDAPLDDANVVRFCDLLDQMKEQTDTRFLVVTHNPITMARMSRLFGVTMAERGVSQMVSVDLETAESFREAG